MARSDVEIYRQPHTDRWIAQCWEPGCRWQMGADGVEQKSHLLDIALAHRREHRPLLDRDAVFQILRQVCLDAGAVDDYAAGPAVAQVMELARPMPTREQVTEALLSNWTERSDAKVVASPIEHCQSLAGAVMVLLKGAKS